MEKEIRCPRVGCTGVRNGASSDVLKKGFFRRSFDAAAQKVQRYGCKLCGLLFSEQTLDPTYRQHKPYVNESVRRDLCHGVSMRSIAVRLGLTMKTVARKLEFLADRARLANASWRAAQAPAEVLFFDEVETFEVSKARPLSIFLFVNERYEYLFVSVARRPCKGKLAEASRAKYGKLPNERAKVLAEALGTLAALVPPQGEVRTDKDPLYGRVLEKLLPDVRHITFKGRKPRPQGMGELKKGGYDPLFPLNQRAARLRDHIKRLARKTWCTTKKAERLADHLEIYLDYHNTELVPRMRRHRKR